MELQQDKKTLAIRKLNDQLRKYGQGGEIMLTQGIQALGEQAIIHVMTLMQCFDDFSEGDDPYQEHDFGAFKFNGQKIFFKISYYDLKCEYHSPDPADPTATKRVLTIMLAEEY